MTPPTVAVGNTLPPSQNQLQARLRVNVDLLDGANEIRVKNRHFKIKYYTPGSLAQTNECFIRALDSLRLSMPQQSLEIQSLPDQAYQASLLQLSKIGSQAYALLPLDCQEYLAELDARAAEDGKGLMLDFTFPPEMSLFWEMVYTGKPDDPVDISKFWGFRYPIGYSDWESDLEDRIRLRQGIFASIYERLDHSQEEVWQIGRILSEFAKSQDLRLVLHTPRDVFLVDEFNQGRFFEFLHTEPFIYGIVHFACHCINPDNQGASESCLQITAHNQDVFLRLARFLGSRRVGFRYKPFVFLNACELATPKHFLEAQNFPSVLLDFGAGGVIATACTIPDNFALAFSTTFYHFLFEKSRQGNPAYFSEALLETRLEFLHKYHNPLGLAYGLCAETTQWLKVAD